MQSYNLYRLSATVTAQPFISVYRRATFCGSASRLNASSGPLPVTLNSASFAVQHFDKDFFGLFTVDCVFAQHINQFG